MALIVSRRHDWHDNIVECLIHCHNSFKNDNVSLIIANVYAPNDHNNNYFNQLKDLIVKIISHRTSHCNKSYYICMIKLNRLVKVRHEKYRTLSIYPPGSLKKVQFLITSLFLL